jgi:hypothetical protein
MLRKKIQKKQLFPSGMVVFTIQKPTFQSFSHNHNFPAHNSLFPEKIHHFQNL